MGRKRGFTLVELIAVIAILSIILVLTVPSLLNNLSDKKLKAKDKVIELIKTSVLNYLKDYDMDAPVSVSINDLCGTYIDCPIIDPSTGGEITGFVSIDSNKNYSIVSGVTLTLDLNYGSTTQVLNNPYAPFETVVLSVPTKENYSFDGWEVIVGDASVNGNIVTLGNTSATLFAKWKVSSIISLDLNGGSTTQTLNENYTSGDVITLVAPTRTGYTFMGWTLESGDGELSGDIFTVGNGNAVIKANWQVADTTPPTCTISATADSTTITATASDTGGSGIAGKGWSTSYDGSTTKTVSATGTVTYYVKDGAGNTGTCSATITATTDETYCNCGYSHAGACYTNIISNGQWVGAQYCSEYLHRYICDAELTKLNNSYCFKAD